VCRQRELVSEVCDLKSQLDTATATCHELSRSTRSPDSENKVSKSSVDDEESRVLKKKMAEMLSDEYVTVEPRQHSILKHLRLLVDSVRRHHLVCIPFYCK